MLAPVPAGARLFVVRFTAGDEAPDATKPAVYDRK